MKTDFTINVKQVRKDSDLRKEEYLDAVRNYFRPLLNSDGSWNIELTSESGRLDLQLACAFYRGDQEDVRLANLLTRRAPVSVHNGHRFDIFQSSIACHHLVVFGELMEPETVEWCKQGIVEGCINCPGMVAPDLQFQGYNDNMPAMATKTLILGGELLNRPDLFEIGLWKLRRFAEQLTRSGVIGEYNSPNYTPDTVHNLTTLAKYTKSAECRELAEKIVKRVWLDLATHWHPAGKCAAGPFSRAYNPGFNNYISMINCVVALIFGDTASNISVFEAISPREGIELMHSNDPMEHACRVAWYAVLDDSLLDDATAALFLKKSYPYQLIASAEQGDTGEAPLKKSMVTTYMTEDYSLGSASFAFHGGQQTASLYATGTSVDGNISPVAALRYLANDIKPGIIGENDWHRMTTGECEMRSQGTAVTLQNKNAALASYVPHLFLNDTDISSLGLALIAPCSVGQFDGFFDCSGKELEPDIEYPVGKWYGARLGAAVIGFYPLAYSAIGLPEPVMVLRKSAKYQYLEIINYQGETRRFTRDELAVIFNGMAFEIASSADWDTPVDFLQALDKAAVFEDQFVFGTRRLRYYRSAIKDRPEQVLVLNYSTSYDGFAVRIIDGKTAPEPVWQCTGMPSESLPFLGDDGVIAPPGIPWDDLKVHWYPERYWAINKSSNCNKKNQD